MKTSRARLDEVAWETLHARPKPASPPLGLAKGSRPANYSELGDLIASGVDFEIAWGEFLHEFFRYRAPSFFAYPSPGNISPEYRALLAGVAEFLSKEFELPVPIWVFGPEYYLDHEWDILSEELPDVEQYREERRARSHDAFLRRNVIFEPRNLITL